MLTTPPVDTPQRHRLTVDDYYRMAEVGILQPDQRIELIEGELIDMPPIGSLHAGTVDHLATLLQRAVADAAIVRCQSPVSLGRYSEPPPDIALLRPRADFYKSAHPAPANVFLIVEVGYATRDFDRDVKVPLYARHGIAEVWLVDLRDELLVRYRKPWEAGYAQRDLPNLDEPLTIEQLGNVRVDLAGIFAA